MNTSLPANWAEATLGDIVAVRRSRSDPQDFPEMPFVGMDNVEAHTMRLLGTVPAGTMRSNATHFLPQDILYGRLRPYLNKVLAPIFEGLASAEFIPLTPEADMDRDFIRYRINAADFVSFTSHLDEGDRPRVDWNGIRQFQLALPPKGEQRRIVEAIDSYLSRLDDAVASFERVQAKLNGYRASVLKAAVEGRLVPTEASLARAEKGTYEPAEVLLARILKERRRRWEETELAKFKTARKTPKDDGWKARYEDPMAPDTSKLPGLPEGWCWATMDQLSTRITSGSRDWTKYYDRGSAVFVMAQNVRPSRLDLSFRQLIDPPVDDPSCGRSQVEVGDVLVTIVGANTGTVCRVSACLPRHYVCQSVALMRPVEAEMSSFIEVYLNSPNGKSIYDQYMYGQGRPHLSFDQLRETPVPLPPLTELKAIGGAVEEMNSTAAAVSNSVLVDSARCSRLRKAVLKWAFEGKLVGQDPNDEPAENLLARIRAERGVAVPTKKSRGRTAKEAA